MWRNCPTVESLLGENAISSTAWHTLDVMPIIFLCHHMPDHLCVVYSQTNSSSESQGFHSVALAQMVSFIGPEPLFILISIVSLKFKAQMVQFHWARALFYCLVDLNLTLGVE